MKKYIIKRLLIAIPTLIGITLIDYAIMCFAGNPLEMLQGARISQEAVAAREAALGLDQPFYVAGTASAWKPGDLHQNI